MIFLIIARTHKNNLRRCIVIEKIKNKIQIPLKSVRSKQIRDKLVGKGISMVMIRCGWIIKTCNPNVKPNFDIAAITDIPSRIMLNNFQACLNTFPNPTNIIISTVIVERSTIGKVFGYQNPNTKKIIVGADSPRKFSK